MYIYGIVKDILKDNNTIFVDIGSEKNGFLQPGEMPENLRAGDSIVVQVKRDELGKKGAKLTTKIDNTSIFEKLEKAKESNEPVLLYNANEVNKIVYRLFTNNTKKIYVNNKEIYQKLLLLFDVHEAIEGSRFDQIECREGIDYIKEFGLVTELAVAKQGLLWLKSGGFIVVEKTMALTTIDVNSGKGTASKDSIYKTNEEAAIEAAKQIRLKNIGGMIVIDFINMEDEEEKKAVKALFISETQKDRSKVTVYDFTRLGLLELTRKRL